MQRWQTLSRLFNNIAMQKPHVLVVEDEAAIAELIVINLKHAGFTCEVVVDANAAKDAAFERLPDLVLLDWMLPGMSGASLAKVWRSQPETKDLPIIMLTARSQEVDKVSALEAGADDYITKPFSTKELIARMRAVLRRRAPTLPQGGTFIRVGHLFLDLDAHRVMAEGHEVKLAPTEFKLLTALMQQSEKALARDVLQTLVWGRYSDIDERTVDVHIKRLREAIKEASVSAAAQIETVRGAGYRLSQLPQL